MTPRRGENTFHVYSVPRPWTISSVSRPSGSSACRSWTMARLWSNRSPALIVSRAHRDGVGHEPGGREGDPAFVRGRARDGLKRLSAVVDEPHTRRNDRADVVVAPVELPAHLPLVIGAQQPGPEVADGRLGGRANDASSPPKVCGAPLEDTCHAGRTGSPSSDCPCSVRPLGGRRIVRRAHPTGYSRMTRASGRRR